MRAPRRLAVLVLAVVALLGWGAGSASAGGPTSAMIVNLTDGRSASVHVSAGGGGYDALMRAFELGGSATSSGSLADPPDVRVVWFVHDVTAWRLQSVYLEDGGVRVATQDADEGGSVWDAAPTWHRLTGAAAAPVHTALEDLGVIGPVDRAASAGAGGAEDASAVAATPTSAAADRTRSPWLLAALTALLGAGAGLVVGRLGWGRADRDLERQLDPVAH